MSTFDPTKMVTCVDKDGNTSKVLVSELTMRPSVYGVIIKDEKILLVRQWDGYDLPGGGIEPGEDMHEALKREIHEETGLTAAVGKIVTCETSFFKWDENNYWHSLLLYYICEVVEGELSIDGIEESEKEYMHDLPEWIPLADIDQITFYNSVDSREIIRKALALR